MFRYKFDSIICSLNSSERDNIINGERTSFFDKVIKSSHLKKDPWEDIIFKKAIINAIKHEMEHSCDEYSQRCYNIAYNRLAEISYKESIIVNTL